MVFAYLSTSHDMPAESAKYADIMQNRKQLAVSLYKKDKISAQKAAEISGEDFEDFFAHLKQIS